MTTSGYRLAWLFGLVLVCALPKRIECSYPGEVCMATRGRDICRSYDTEPYLFYGLELIFHRNLGFAYSREDECR